MEAALYNPAHFTEADGGEISRLITDYPLAAVVAQTDQGLLANHLPLLQGARGDLIGHIALANDLHRILADGAEVLAIFRGEEGYVSPNSYPTKAQHHSHVPTWNYQTVHCHGRIHFSQDEATKRAVVGLLTRQHERRSQGDAGWKMTDAPADYLAQMLGKIVAIRIEVSRIEAKSKLSQNRETLDRDGAISAFRAAGKTALADAMQAAAARAKA